METGPAGTERPADEDDIRDSEDLDSHPDEPAEGADPGSGNVGPAEDIENDPAYSPDDEELRRIKGA